MKDQTITISLKEYKELRDALEKLTQENEYWKGQYNLLSFAYTQLAQQEEAEVKEKKPIGFIH